MCSATRLSWFVGKFKFKEKYTLQIMKMFTNCYPVKCCQINRWSNNNSQCHWSERVTSSKPLPYGPSFLMNGKCVSCSRQNMISGRTNTSVLPLPVNAIPIMSRPDSLSEKISILTYQTVITYNVLHALPHTVHLAEDLCKTHTNISISVISSNSVRLLTQPEFGQAIQTFHKKYRQLSL